MKKNYSIEEIAANIDFEPESNSVMRFYLYVDEAGNFAGAYNYAECFTEDMEIKGSDYENLSEFADAEMTLDNEAFVTVCRNLAMQVYNWSK